MSGVKFGSNVTIDGGPDRRGAEYNAAVLARLNELARSEAGRAALADLARQSRAVRIVPPTAHPLDSVSGNATGRRGSTPVVIAYTPTPTDPQGMRLLEALVNTVGGRATGDAVGRRMQKPVRVVTPVGSAAPIM